MEPGSPTNKTPFCRPRPSSALVGRLRLSDPRLAGHVRSNKVSFNRGAGRGTTGWLAPRSGFLRELLWKIHWERAESVHDYLLRIALIRKSLSPSKYRSFQMFDLRRDLLANLPSKSELLEWESCNYTFWTARTVQSKIAVLRRVVKF